MYSAGVVRELSLAYPDIMMGRFWEAMRHKPACVYCGCGERSVSGLSRHHDGQVLGGDEA